MIDIEWANLYTEYLRGAQEVVKDIDNSILNIKNPGGLHGRDRGRGLRNAIPITITISINIIICVPLIKAVKRES